MGYWEVKMKTHSREDITEQYPDLNDCIVHHHKPKILKIVSGKRKETFYTAHCDHDDCGKISHDPKITVDAWNKWNPKPIVPSIQE